jgi:hypothetical protein
MPSPSIAAPPTLAPPQKATLWVWIAINLLVMALSLGVASSGFALPA